MISALAWVPRGVAKAVPTSAEYTEEELAAAKAAADEAGDEEDGDSEWEEESSDGDEMDASGDEAEGGVPEEDKAAQVAKAKAFAASLKADSKAAARRSAADELDAAMAELDMDHYDDDEEEEGGGVRGVFGNTNPGMAYYGSNAEDPYLKLAAVPDAASDSEAEDYEIRGDDFLLLAARTEDEVSHLEVWVYEEADAEGGPSNMYVHHDLMLTAFPLCLAWLDCRPGGGAAGNLAAVGTMGPGVEVWDLDVADAVEPAAMLGGELLPDGGAAAGPSEAAASKKKKKKKKARPLREGSHGDAVLALSWNREFRNVLASGSADATVKVWDVAAEACSATLAWHSDKVQAVAWNPADAPVLLSGGFDRNVFLGDARAPSGNLSWECSADVEALAWDPHNPLRFLVASEDGIVAAHDARAGAGGGALFRLSAHDKPTCCLSFNAAAKGLLATASTDKQVKLWDVSDKPSLVAAHELKAGALFTGSFCPERPNLFAAGGAKGELVVWDILSSAAVASRYGKELAQHAAQAAQPAPAS